MLEERLRQQMEVKTGFARQEKQAQLLLDLFKKMDSNGNMQLSYDEFEKAMKNLNFITRPAVMQALFAKYDTNGTNYIDLQEFTRMIFSKKGPSMATGEHIPKPQNTRLASKVGISPAGKFTDLENKIVSECTGSNEPKAWASLDINGNGYVSLAEFDVFISNRYPILNNKPALMWAYKRACGRDVNGQQDYVERGDFLTLIRNAIYFNQVFQAFEQIDTGADRRIDEKEFTNGVKYLGVPMKPQEVQSYFLKMDANHSGLVDFGEFCNWYLERKNL